MKLNELTGYLEKIAPLSLQESYDNAGLLIGDPEQEAGKALICLDVTMGVLEEALEGGFDLIISHHPLIFGGIKQLCGRNETEKIIIAAIKNGIAIYAMHTNLDNIETGVNAILCEKLGIRNARILQAMSGKLNKLVTFSPADHAHRLREALFAAGIHPLRTTDTLSAREIGTLCQAIKKVLNTAIDSKGASVDTYIRPEGQQGTAQSGFKVAHRKGESCLTCGTSIERITVRNRGTYFCPCCQPDTT